MSDDETANATLTRRIYLTGEADHFIGGWKELVMLELDRMRAEMPYADSLDLRLTCRRRAE